MKGLYQWYLFATLCLLFISCQHKPVSEESSRSHFIQSTAEDYFATYAEREDWEKLCSFYREDVQFEDVMLQLHLDSLWKFKRFYNWPDTGFAKLYPEQKHLVIETLTVNDSMAIARGYINPFYWYGLMYPRAMAMESLTVRVSWPLPEDTLTLSTGMGKKWIPNGECKLPSGSFLMKT